jgi:simple sugar transport system permease protein
VILFTGALDNMVRMPMEKLVLAMRRRRKAAEQRRRPEPEAAE